MYCKQLDRKVILSRRVIFYSSSPSRGSPFLNPSHPRTQGTRMASAMRMAPIVFRKIASSLKSMYFCPSCVMTTLPTVSSPVELKRELQ